MLNGIVLLMDNHKIKDLDRKHVFRSIGKNGAGGLVGYGFMHKKGLILDEKDSFFQFYSLVYVIKGRGTYIDCENNKHSLSAGSIFQRFPGIKHTTILDPESDWLECYIDLGKNIFDLLVSMNIINTDIPVHKLKKGFSVEQEVFKKIGILENCKEHKLPDMVLESMKLLRSILVRSEEFDSDTYPDNLIEFSCNEFTNDFRKRIDLRDFCRINGWGYESFRKQFKSSIGISPGKYIIRRRIDMACQYLRGSEKSIGEISYELGYKSQYEFSAQFKRQIGIAPSIYRKSR